MTGSRELRRIRARATVLLALVTFVSADPTTRVPPVFASQSAHAPTTALETPDPQLVERAKALLEAAPLIDTEDVMKIAGRNLLRAMRQMERVAADLRKATPPMVDDPTGRQR